MTITVLQNRYSNLAWPGVEWLNATTAINNSGFYVHCGPNVELLYHPDTLLKFREREFLGVVLEHDSIHEKRPDFPAPLGYPKWRDDFWVLRLGTRYAIDFLDGWWKSQDVSAIVWAMGVQPTQYPPDVIKVHCDQATMPKIVWGLK